MTSRSQAFCNLRSEFLGSEKGPSQCPQGGNRLDCERERQVWLGSCEWVEGVIGPEVRLAGLEAGVSILFQMQWETVKEFEARK